MLSPVNTAGMALDGHPLKCSTDDIRRLTPLAHCIRPSMDLTDFARGDPEMHCGSVRYVGSVSCVQKLRKCLLFRL